MIYSKNQLGGNGNKDWKGSLQGLQFNNEFMRDFKKFEIMVHGWKKPRREENISNSIAHNFGVLVWLVCYNKIS